MCFNKTILSSFLLLLFAFSCLAQKPSARDARKQAYTRAMEARKTKNELDPNLFAAIKNNDLPVVDSLLDAGVNLHAADKDGANALMWACYYGDSTMVASLFDRGAVGPEVGGGIYYEGETTLGTPIKGWYGSPLAVAAGEGKVDVLNYLLEVQKVDVDEQPMHLTRDSLSGWTALMHGVRKENITSFLILKERNCSFKNINAIGKSALEVCEDVVFKKILTNNDNELISKLYAYKAIVDSYQKATNEKKWILAIQHGLEKKMKCAELYGDSSAVYGVTLENLAYAYESNREFEKTEVTRKLAIQLIEQNLGTEHKYYLIFNNNLATLYMTQGLNEKALPISQLVLELSESILGKDHSAYGFFLNNTAVVNLNLGNIEKSISLFHKVLSMTESQMGKDHYLYGVRLNNLASAYSRLNLFEKVLPIREEALENTRKNFGKNSAVYARRLQNLGTTYNRIHKHDKAIVCFDSALSIIEEQKGKDHYDYGVVLNNLGLAYLNKGLYDKAYDYFQEASANTLNSLGENHPWYATRLRNIALLYYKKRDYKNALEYYSRALEIVKANSKNSNLKSVELLSDIAKVNFKSNLHTEASHNYINVLKKSTTFFQQNFNFLSPSLQKEWIKANKFYFNQMASFYFDHPIYLNKIFLNYSIMIEGVVKHNVASFSRNIGYDNNYTRLKSQIAHELSKPLTKQSPSLDSLQREAEKLETFLLANNKNFKNQNQEVTVKKLKQKLTPKEAIIDIVHFNYYDIDRKTDTILYVAYLLANDRDSIQSIKLFEEKELQTILSSSTNSDNMLAQLYTRSSDPKFPSKKMEGLSMIWKPLLPHLKNYETIYLSPSGLLNKINLGAITVSENKLASDQFKLVQYNSLRSMLEEFDERPNNDFLLVGGVNYKAPVTEIKPDTNDLFVATSTAEYTDETIREMRSRVTRGENWNELPGTKLEVQQIEKLLDQKKYNYTSLMDTSATEEQVKQLLSQETSPRVVHFSTHGFFYPDPDSDDKNGSAFRISDDPMIRSGLILAGADYAWEKGEVPPGREDDGILTAYEVANLNLTDTDLVVLSACETGLGDIQGSEGVFGLQRAFKIAGARYIIMSLWSVEDEATQQMMVLFYRNWLDKGMEIPDAFRMAQREMCDQYKGQPNKWAGFVLIE